MPRHPEDKTLRSKPQTRSQSPKPRKYRKHQLPESSEEQEYESFVEDAPTKKSKPARRPSPAPARTQESGDSNKSRSSHPRKSHQTMSSTRQGQSSSSSSHSTPPASSSSTHSLQTNRQVVPAVPSDDEPASDLQARAHFNLKVSHKRKRKVAKGDAIPNIATILIRKARNIPRSINPFVDLVFLLDFGLNEMNERAERGDPTFTDEEEVLESDDSNDELDYDPDAIQHRRLWSSYKQLLAIPDLSETLQAFNSAKEVQEFADEMTRSARSAADGDRGSLKHALISYIPKDPSQDVVVPPIPPTRSKANRGWTHPMIARLLCPIMYLAEYDADPINFRQRVLSGDTRITHYDLPLFLYEEDMHNPKEPEAGLFRGHLFISAFKHIFTSPESAIKSGPSKSSSRPNNAHLHDLTEPTGRECAYIAVLAWFTLSNLDTWKDEDQHFSPHEFYYTCLAFFEDRSGLDWAQETLKFIKDQVFGDTGVGRKSNRAPPPQPPPPTSSLALARTARKNRAKARRLATTRTA